MYVLSFDVADGKQPEFIELLGKHDFHRFLGEGQKKEYLPESTMIRIKPANIANLKMEIESAAKDKNIEILRMLIHGGSASNGIPDGISISGTKIHTKE